MNSNDEQIKLKIEKEVLLPKELSPLIEKASGKICVVIHPDKKYVGYIKHIIWEIKNVMSEFNITVKTLSEEIAPQHSNYSTILSFLKECILGIVILDGFRPNVILEYGILIGLEKPIIVLKDKSAKIAVTSFYLDDKVRKKFKTHKIDEPFLDIDKHLSDVKDLHYTSYNWREPDEFKKVLKDAFIKEKDEILREITKSITTKEIATQKPEIYNKFQEAFEKIAKYTINLKKSDYDEIVALNKEIDNLSKEYGIQLSPHYYFELGNIYSDLSKYDEALEAFGKAIGIKPDYAEAWYNKGVALINLEKYDEALEAFGKAIGIKPDYAEAWYNKGVVFGSLGKHNEEIDCYDKATKINPDYEKAWYNKGVVFGSLGKHNEALKCFKEATKINPNDEKAWNNKGVALINLGKYEDALDAFGKAIGIKPDYAKAWYNKGVALINLGKYEDALDAFGKAIGIKPDYAKAWYNKACVYSFKRDKENALKNLLKAIELDPKLKEDAKKDKDFKNLWNDKDFKKIVD